jgi:hypothetical protein
MKPAAAGFALSALALTQLAHAQTESHWINPNGGSFGDPANWSPAGVPDGTKQVFFDLAAAYTATLDTARFINGLVVSAGNPILDLNNLRLTMEESLAVSGPTFTLRRGELYMPPTLSYGSINVTGGTLILEADARVSHIGGSLNVSTGATYVVRGLHSWCTASNQCVNFFASNSGTVRIEGGAISAGSYNSTGLTEMIGGLISHDGGGSSGTLIMSNGARFGGWSITGLSGSFHLMSGAELYGQGQQSSYILISGTGLLEGANTRISEHFTVQNNGQVTVRGGAHVGIDGPSSASLRNNGSLIIQSAGTVIGPVDAYDSSRFRLEPGALGTPRVWFISPNARFEFLLDGSRQSATPTITCNGLNDGLVIKGHLEIEVLNTNRLAVGDSFTLFSHPGGLSGSFTSVTVPVIDGGRALVVTTDPTGAYLRVLQGLPSCYSHDFNGDGDFGTDQDIEAFFACLAGQCCATCPTSADFNGDGDVGTDQDIEAFFRILGGNLC